ncbi:MAG: SBBP repeat-containing protein [Verrucomicrobiota bacterium]
MKLNYLLSIALLLSLPLRFDLVASPVTTEKLASLPLSFEVNQGQADADFKFLAWTPEALVLLKSTEARFSLRHPNSFSDGTSAGGAKPSNSRPIMPRQGTQVSLTLIGADSSASANPEQELPGKVSYFIGNDPAKWHPAVPTFARVRFRQVYPGIDWLCYGNRQHLEYDFLIAPGADPSQIALRFEGVNKIEIDTMGDLVIRAAGGEIRQHKPNIFQDIAGEKHFVEGGYFLINDHQVGFRLAPYEPTHSLVIDPTLVYSTFFGSSNAVADLGKGIGLDAAGNIFVAGETSVSAGGAAFLVKLNPAGNQILHSILIGGTSGNQTFGLAVNPDGSSSLVGLTSSADFPTTTNAVQPGLKDITDYFVVKVNAAWDALVFSTYLGSVASSFGPAPDTGGVAMDPQGNVYVVGSTSATDFPVTIGAFQSKLRNDFNDDFLRTDAFVTKLNSDGSMAYSTYLGSNGEDRGNSIAVDALGSAYVTGNTPSADFPLKNPIFGDTFTTTAFVTKLSPDGSDLLYSTFIPGVSDGRAIALDASGNAYLTGVAGGGLPTTVGAFQPQPSNNGSQDAFLLKLNSDGSAISYATYLGGNGADQGMAVAADSAGNAAVTGFTGFTGTTRFFPTTNSLQNYAGNLDVFVAKFDPNGNVIYSTYLGGSQSDVGLGIALGTNANVYVVGETESADFPTVSPFRGDYRDQDAFIARISDATPTNRPPQQFKLFNSFGFIQNGSFDMHILTVPLFHYRLEYSTNLRTWDLLTLFQADVDGTFHYGDIFASAFPQKFYRVIVNTNFSGVGKMSP